MFVGMVQALTLYKTRIKLLSKIGLKVSGDKEAFCQKTFLNAPAISLVGAPLFPNHFHKCISCIFDKLHSDRQVIS